MGLMHHRRSPFAAARWLVAVGALGAGATFSGSAAALPLIGVSASLRGLYGFALGDSLRVEGNGAAGTSSSSDWNPYHLGLGVRGGVTLSSIYVGASLDYFFAETTHVTGFEVSGGRLQVMGNVGYEFGLPLLTLRPLVGLGYAHTNIDADSAGSASKQELVIAPGAELLVNLGLINVSGELRYNWSTTDAVVVGVGVGLSF
jgi:hypothetical protein